MAFIKGVKGLSGKLANSYYNDTLATPNACVFNGATYYKIGEGNGGGGLIPYNPLDKDTARTYLMLFKVNSTLVNTACIYETQKDQQEGEYIMIYIEKVLLRIQDININNINAYSLVETRKGKYNVSSPAYDGTLVRTGLDLITNGVASKGTASGVTLNSSLNADGFGYIGAFAHNSTGFLNGSLAIFSIYKGILTNQQQTEFTTEPFGFLASLRSNPSDFHLDIDFNKTGTDLPVDISSNGFPISLGVGATSYEAFS